MNTQTWQGLAQFNKTLHRIATVSFIFLITFGAQSFADDTEIFLKISGDVDRKPNVIIMLDSSSSMNASIQYVDGYEPDIPLPADATPDCDENKIYVKTGTNNQLPSCSGGGVQYINPEALRCKDVVEFMIKVGSLNDRVFQWNAATETWGAFGTAADEPNAPIECFNDQGDHGDRAILHLDADNKVAINEVAYETETIAQPYITSVGTVDAVTGIKEAWSATPDPSLVFDDGKFVTFYTGHFLNYAKYVIANKNKPEFADLYHNESGYDLAVEAMSQIVDDYDSFNMGLARYNQSGSKTAFILAPVSPLDDPDVKEELKNNYLYPMGYKSGATQKYPEPPETPVVASVDNSFSGGQPMAAGQYETYLYYTGRKPFGGGNTGDPSPNNISSPQPPPATNAIPTAICQSGDTDCILGNYKSPIVDSCQKNYVLYLTASGTSANDPATETKINAAEGWTNAETPVSETLKQYNGNKNCGTGNDDCLDELTGFMFEHDLAAIPNGIGENGEPVIQNVSTYGISINANAPDLDEAAVRGGGTFRKAENPGAIAALLQEVLNDIIGKNSSFVAPSISVNNFNRLQNLDDLYFSLFTPTDTRVWIGNLKKYKLKFGKIIDKLTNLAVDTDTGAFKDNALSYWTDPTDSALADAPVKFRDGNESGLGGFASRMLISRNVYTNLSAGSGNVKLTLNSTALNESNASITKTLLGIETETDEYRTALLAWGAGYTYDEDGTTKISTKFVGDLLHTTPLVLTYGSAATDASQLDQSIFFGTNNGFLHAIKANPSDSPADMEHFAFAPYETLSNLDTFYKNENLFVEGKLYGLDGPITAWIDETAPKNKIVDSGEDAYLYVTQRRGGRTIYALNVANRADPKLVWKIRGGETGFEDLGQTWSAVQHATIKKSNGDNLEVVFFAGGYDTNQDTGSSSSAAPATASATMGNAVYMVNAKTGELLWSAGDATSTADLKLSDMTYAIPSDLKVLDVNVDGYADRIYVGDLGGQVWRFDIANEPYDPASTADYEITGGVIAKLNQASASDTATGTTNRRFFSAPTVALVSNNSYGTYLSIALGSGYRSHPLDEVLNDKFYMIKDYNINSPVLDASGIPVYDPDAIIYDDSETPSDTTQLIDITSNAQPEFSTIVNRSGWVIDFTKSGEKVINPAITADNKIYFTTYIPENEAVSALSCVPNSQLGKSRLYSVSLLNGGVTGEIQYDDNGDPIDQDPEERYEELTAPGISPPPELVSGPDDPLNPTLPASCSSTTKVTLIVGTQTFDPDICTAPVKTYWNRVD